MRKLKMSRGDKCIQTDAKYTLKSISLCIGLQEKLYDVAMKDMSAKSKHRRRIEIKKAHHICEPPRKA